MPHIPKFPRIDPPVPYTDKDALMGLFNRLGIEFVEYPKSALIPNMVAIKARRRGIQFRFDDDGQFIGMRDY